MTSVNFTANILAALATYHRRLVNQKRKHGRLSDRKEEELSDVKELMDALIDRRVRVDPQVN